MLKGLNYVVFKRLFSDVHKMVSLRVCSENGFKNRQRFKKFIEISESTIFTNLGSESFF